MRLTIHKRRYHLHQMRIKAGVGEKKDLYFPCHDSHIQRRRICMSATSYFQGLGFPCFGIHRESSISTDANPFFYGLQYIHSGHLYLSVNDGRRYVLKGPVAFLTSPDVRFSYGSPENTSRDHYFVCFEGKRISEYLKTGLFIPAAAQEHPYIPITAPASFLSKAH